MEVDNNSDCPKCEDNNRPYNNDYYEKVDNCEEYEEKKIAENYKKDMLLKKIID